MLTRYPVVYRAGGVYLTPWFYRYAAPWFNTLGKLGALAMVWPRGFVVWTLGVSVRLAKTYNPLYIALGVHLFWKSWYTRVLNVGNVGKLKKYPQFKNSLPTKSDPLTSVCLHGQTSKFSAIASPKFNPQCWGQRWGVFAGFLRSIDRAIIKLIKISSYLKWIFWCLCCYFTSILN